MMSALFVAKEEAGQPSSEAALLVAVSLAAVADAHPAGFPPGWNGLATTPPMGWRSWYAYYTSFDQGMIETVIDALVAKNRTVAGWDGPVSLCDLGYCDVGLDDNWQKCGEYGRKKGTLTSHDEHGTPMVNTKIFPDLKAMTDHAHKLGLTAGWYANNCICREHATDHTKFYRGDIQALREYGFDSWKLDGCGAQLDLGLG